MAPNPDPARPFPFRLATALAAALVAVLVVLGAPAAGAAAARLTGGPLYGGMVMTDSSGFRCISGFNAHSGSTYYVITASSCTSSASSWYIGGDYLGPSAASGWPGGGYGLIKVADPTHWQPQGAIRVAGATVQITGAGNATVGQQVCYGNETSSGVHCGTVQAVNVSVNFGDGVIYGRPRRTCAISRATPARRSSPAAPRWVCWSVVPVTAPAAAPRLSATRTRCSASTDWRWSSAGPPDLLGRPVDTRRVAEFPCVPDLRVRVVVVGGDLGPAVPHVHGARLGQIQPGVQHDPVRAQLTGGGIHRGEQLQPPVRAPSGGCTSASAPRSPATTDAARRSRPVADRNG